MNTADGLNHTCPYSATKRSNQPSTRTFNPITLTLEKEALGCTEHTLYIGTFRKTDPTITYFQSIHINDQVGKPHAALIACTSM